MADEHTNGGRVTIRDVYAEIRASEERIMAEIRRSRDRSDAVHQRLMEADAANDNRTDELDKRLTVIEDRQTLRTAIQTSVAVVLSAIAAWIGTRQ